MPGLATRPQQLYGSQDYINSKYIATTLSSINNGNGLPADSPYLNNVERVEMQSKFPSVESDGTRVWRFQ